jgi:hypothetical protein
MHNLKDGSNPKMVKPPFCFRKPRLALKLENRNLTTARCRTVAIAFTDNSALTFAILHPGEKQQPDNPDDANNSDPDPKVWRNHVVNRQPKRPRSGLPLGGERWTNSQSA